MKKRLFTSFLGFLLISSMTHAMDWRRASASLIIASGAALLAARPLVSWFTYRQGAPFTLRNNWFRSIGYGIAGTYGQRNTVPGWGTVDCSLLAMTAAGYFLYRQDWDLISDDELALVAVNGIFSGRGYRAGLYADERRRVDADRLICVDEVGPWHNTEFLNRLVYQLFRSVDMGLPACRYDAMPLMEIAEHGASRLVTFMQRISRDFDENRICMVMTVRARSCILCYDRETGRWIFYDSHHRPEQVDCDGSALYVFDKDCEKGVATFLDELLHLVGADLTFALYAAAEAWRMPKPAVVTSEQRIVFDRALELFAAGDYASVTAVLESLCTHLPDHAALVQPAVVLADGAQHAQEELVRLVCQSAVAAQTLRTITDEIVKTTAFDQALFDGLPAEQKALAIDGEQVLSRLTTVSDEQGGFLRFVAARMIHFLTEHDSGVIEKLPSGVEIIPVHYEMALFLARDFTDIFALLAADGPDRLAHVNERIDTLLATIPVNYAHIEPVIRWFLENVRTQVVVATA